MKILVTGFEPFLDNDINPSKELVESSLFASFDTMILPVSYGKARESLLLAIDSINPDLVLSFGLASSRKGITIEKKAINMLDAKCPDADGVTKRKEIIDPSLPPSLVTEFPLEELVNALKKDGIPLSISLDAGRYICNEVFFTSLAQKPLSLFVHLPAFSISSLDDDIILAKAIMSFIKHEVCLSKK